MCHDVISSKCVNNIFHKTSYRHRHYFIILTGYLHEIFIYMIKYLYIFIPAHEDLSVSLTTLRCLILCVTPGGILFTHILIYNLSFLIFQILFRYLARIFSSYLSTYTNLSAFDIESKFPFLDLIILYNISLSLQ